MSKDAHQEPAKVEDQVIGRDIGRTTLAEVGQHIAQSRTKPRAVLFVPEGADFDPNMEIQVIGINEEGMQAIVARRC